MEARDKLSVILAWIDDFRSFNPKRVDQIKDYIHELFNEWSETGGKLIRTEQEHQDQLTDILEQVEGMEAPAGTTEKDKLQMNGYYHCLSDVRKLIRSMMDGEKGDVKYITDLSTWDEIPVNQKGGEE